MPPRARALASVLLLTAFVLAVFGRAGWSYPLLRHWDDEANLTENAAVANPSWDKLPHVWLQPHLGMYVPVTYTVWAGVGAVSQLVAGSSGDAPLNPHLFHCLNISLHLLNALMVWALLRGLFGSEVAAVVGALIFAVHPLQVEPVVWASSTKDVLSAFFFLVSLLCLPRALQAKSRPRGLLYDCLAIGGATLAFASKPSTVTLPLLWAAWAWSQGLLRSSRVLCRLGLILTLAIFSAGLSLSLQPEAIGVSLPMGSRLLVASDALWFYLSKLLVPLNFVIDYAREPQRVLMTPTIYLHAALLASAATLLWFGRRTGPGRVLTLAAVGFVALLAPNLGLVSFTFQRISTVADRYAYLAMLAPAYGVAACYHGFTERRRLAVAILGLSVVSLAALSWHQVGFWRDDRTLVEHSLALAPDSAMAHHLMGSIALDDHDSQRAIREYGEALRLDPHLDRALNGMGMALIETGDFERARGYLAATPAGTPYFYLAKTNLCLIHVRQRDALGGLADCEEAAHSDPSCALCQLNLGSAYGDLGRYSDAEKEFRLALEIQPSLLPAHTNLTVALVALRRSEEALREFQQLIALVPKDQAVPLTPIDAALAVQMEPLAESLLRTLLTQRPLDPSAHSRLGLLYAKLGRVQEAVPYLRQAINLNPEDRDAARALAALVP